MAINRFRLSALVLLIPLMVACSSSSATGGATTQELMLKAMDTLKFDKTMLTAKAGQPIHLTLDNSAGEQVHDFSITEGIAQPIAVTAQPGQKANGTFTIDKPGTYTYFCSQPGHREAGMVGMLRVD
jgi:uncharacterized cupredoxin-like copper-binding protein